VNFEYASGLFLASGLLLYLVYALLQPEKF
jgi:K+-transporting ATPase KdpF subunit